jgi:hypothetical protein
MTEAYTELRKRISDKQDSLTQKEEELKDQLNDIRSSISPGKLIVGAVKNVFSEAAPPNGFVKTGIGIGATVLADKLLFRKRGFIIRALGMFVVRRIVNKITSRKQPQPDGD